MLLNRIRKSLTVRIFFITTLILLAAGVVTFGLLAIVTPDTYTVVINDELTHQMEDLVKKFGTVPMSGSGTLLDEFIRETGAEAYISDKEGNIVDTGSRLAVKAGDAEEEGTSDDEYEYNVGYYYSETDGTKYKDAESDSALSAEIHFADTEEPYILTVYSRFVSENMMIKALIKVAPWLLLILLVFSLLCSLVYSRYITKPIVELNDIAGKLAEQDFDWSCDESRQDEIGHLGQSLNTMSRNLSGALSDLKASNAALRGEVEQEKELDRQRMAFFSAASHELKTPVTILKGHITGMLDGIEVYKDRDKYLARCLQVTGRMENLIGEILSVSRIERGTAGLNEEELDISKIAEEQADLIKELTERKELKVETDLAADLKVKADRSLLSKAVGNLLSNAAYYSPEGETIRIRTYMADGHPILVTENTGVHISEEALPHLFEAFYREEQSRNRRTGGSGLGLYLVRMIMERYGAECRIENIADGVRATAVFPEDRNFT